MRKPHMHQVRMKHSFHDTQNWWINNILWHSIHNSDILYNIFLVKLNAYKICALCCWFGYAEWLLLQFIIFTCTYMMYTIGWILCQNDLVWFTKPTLIATKHEMCTIRSEFNVTNLPKKKIIKLMYEAILWVW